MAAKTKLLLFVSLIYLALNCMQQYVHGESQVPCLFIFGDSLSDDGNNNNLQTTAKTKYIPYGVDFPLGPTGRFTNGRTSINLIAQHLGFEDFIPPFANTSGSDILKGVNYASGSAGIRPESGTHMGTNVNLGVQMQNHRAIYSTICMKLGDPDKAKEHLNKCLYYINIGSNDYINNYFLPQIYQSSTTYTLDQYSNILIDQLSQNIQALHEEVGARKFVLVGIGLIGCTPNAISNQSRNGSYCDEDKNNAAFMFNVKLKTLVDNFNNNFYSDSKFIFINSTAGTLDSSLGFTVSNASCCPSGTNGLCVPNETPCENRTKYVFWDQFHPTESVNQIIAISSYNGSNPAFTYPMDITHLVQS